jgi:hypothetical protein
MERTERLSHVAQLAARAAGAAAFLICAWTHVAGAVTVNLGPAAATRVFEGNPNTVYGGAADLVVERSEFLEEGLALLRFDLSAIPSNAIVNSAQLELYLIAASDPASVTVRIQRATQTWSASSVTWNTRPALSSTTVASAAVGMSLNTSYTWNLTSLVSSFVSGTATNYGFALRGPADVTFTRVFVGNATSHGARLHVDYSLPTATPTVTRTRTPTRTGTRTATRSPTASNTPVHTVTATTSPTATNPPTVTQTTAPTSTPTSTPTLPPTGTPTGTRTATTTPSGTTAPTHSLPPSATASSTPSRTRTATSSPTHTPTATPTRTRTASASPTATLGRTPTPSPTASFTSVPSVTSTASSCGADPYEPNDALPQAFNIQPSVEYQGIICPAGDADYFALSLAAGTRLRVQLYDLPADYQLNLYGPGGEWLDQSGNRGTRSEEIRYTTIVSGTYSVRVTPKGSAHDRLRPYTLRVTVGDQILEVVPGLRVPDSFARLRGQGFDPAMGGMDCEAQAYWDQVAPARLLGHTPIAADGSFDLGFRVPADATPGTHRLKTMLQCGSIDVPALDALLDGDTAYPDDGCLSPYLPDLDLRVLTMEVTQGVQCLDPALGDRECDDNRVVEVDDLPALVAGRPTVVRVYVTANLNGVFVEAVTAKLYVRRAGDEEPGTPVWPENGPLAWEVGGPFDALPGMRRLAVRTLNFRLPPEWTEGEVILRAQVNPEWACGPYESEENRQNNQSTDLTINFQQRNDLRIAYLPIHYTPPEGCPGDVDELPSDAIQQASQWMYKVYPLAQSPDYVPWAGMLEWDECLSAVDYGRVGRGLIGHLNTLWLASFLAFLDGRGEPPPNQLVGWLPSDAYFGNGSSDPWYYNDGLGHSVFVNDNPDERGKILAHEIGHNLGLNHPDRTPPPWPYGDETIQEHGLDVDVMEVRESSLHDMMAEGGDEFGHWLSPFSFRFLFEGNLRPPAGDGAGASALPRGVGPDESLLVSGRVYTDNRGELDPVYRVPAAGELRNLPEGTRYCLQFLDGRSVELRRRCFDLDFESVDGPVDQAGFAVLEPEPEATARIRLLQDGSLLDERIASPNAPQVTVVVPNGGEEWSGVHTIRWQANDPDGDDLTYTVFHSHDDGQSWRVLAAGLHAEQVAFDTDRAGGGRARVRVVASDGFNTASDESDSAFQIPLKAPSVQIAAPEDGTTFQRPEAVFLRGRGSDPEDGELRGAALQWSSDRDGPLGTGNQVVSPELSRGDHVITLTAVDADGMRGTASVTIDVASPAPDCAGDCRRDATVTVNDLLIMVNVALEDAPVSTCFAGDRNYDGRITVNEILAAVQRVLEGC